MLTPAAVSVVVGSVSYFNVKTRTARKRIEVQPYEFSISNVICPHCLGYSILILRESQRYFNRVMYKSIIGSRGTES